MIKYSAVDLEDGTIRSEAQIEGDIKFLIVEFSRIAGCLYKAFRTGPNAAMSKKLLIAAVETGIEKAEEEQK